MLAILAVAALVLGLFILGQFLGTGTGEPSPSPSASASPSLTPSPSAEPSPSEPESIAPTAPGDAWICGEPITVEATTGEVVHTADVRIGTHEGYDRIVFEYLEDGTPEVDMRLATPPFTQDASGLPITVNGSPVFQITLQAATKLADDGSLTYTGPTEFEPDFPQLVHLTERGDFEAVNSWYVGLNGGDCVQVTVLTNPSRVVVDVQH